MSTMISHRVSHDRTISSRSPSPSPLSPAESSAPRLPGVRALFPNFPDTLASEGGYARRRSWTTTSLTSDREISRAYAMSSASESTSALHHHHLPHHPYAGQTHSPALSSASCSSSDDHHRSPAPQPHMFHVFAPGPGGLSALQTDTLKPIGIVRLHHPHHPQPSAPQRYETLKKHVCAECGAGFSRPSELKTHSHKHTGERPFECALCSRHFSTSSNLGRHMRSIHPRDRPSPASSVSP